MSDTTTMHTLNEKSHKIVLILLAIYLTSLFASNTLGLKLMPFILDTNLSVSVFYFPIVFLMTDVVGEVYGKKTAKFFVLAGFVSTALFILYSLVSLWAPWSNDSLWMQEGYTQIFGVSARVALASLVAFVIAEYQDVFSFFFFKKKWGKKLFWLRSNLSNLWSQFLDTVIFMVIAFAGVYSWPVLLSIIVPWWLYKVVMGVLYTPLSYAAIRMLRKIEGSEVLSEVSHN